MEQRGKRPRLEQINSNTSESNQLPDNNVAIATIGGHSYLINSNLASSNTTGTNPISSPLTSIPANILLTICDDHEAQQFLIDSALLDQIKQENMAVNVSTQTQSGSLGFTDNTLSPLNSVIHQQRSPQILGTMPATNSTTYNELVSSSTSSKSSMNGVILNTSALSLANGATGAAMQLPADCEIYLVKEFLETPSHTSHLNHSSQIIVETMNSAKTAAILNNIKLEPEQKQMTVANDNDIELVKQNLSLSPPPKSQLLPSLSSPVSSSVSSNDRTDEATKRSYILEAYKKRDDKRRATHNEVERRRRDKINNWIFKLKEMLPTDQTTSTETTVRRVKTIQQLPMSGKTSMQQQQQLLSGTRTPPCDSKSQILIKACEYIKAMQEEIQGLRECLTENESLRLCNQRLEVELNLLKSKNEMNNVSKSNNQSGEDINNSCHHLMLESLDGVHLYASITTTTMTTEATTALTMTSALEKAEEGKGKERLIANNSPLSRVDYELDAIQIRDLLKGVSDVTATNMTTSGESDEVRTGSGTESVTYGKPEAIGNF